MDIYEIGRIYGYNRVSTKEQKLDRGNIAIKEFCKRINKPLEKIYVDKQTGRHFGRERYIVLKEDILRPGDWLVIPEYDRLGRADQTKEELEYFKKNNIRIIFLDIITTQIDLNDFPDEFAKMILVFINEMLISFFDLIARTEYERRKKRQTEGIAALRDKPEWKFYGRPRLMESDKFAKEYSRVERGEIGSMALMRELKLPEHTYYRYLREYRNNKNLENKTIVRKDR